MNSLPDKYTTVKQEAHAEFEEKRSVFIGHARHVDSEEEALAFVKEQKKKYADATHNCFAYLLRGGAVARYSDDGEPQGTAGLPMLEAIRKSGAEDVCIVATRYFGGVLLGAGGLVRAYSQTVSRALAEAEIITYEPYSVFELVCGYSEYQKYSNLLSLSGAVTDSTDFSENVRLCFALKRAEADALLLKIKEMSGGRDVPDKIGERFDYR